jgi:hypothetical protein
MDEQTTRAVEAMAEMVQTSGWDHLASDLESKINAIKDVLTRPEETNIDVLRIAQGRLMAYRDLLALPIMLAQALRDHREVDDDSV